MNENEMENFVLGVVKPKNEKKFRSDNPDMVDFWINFFFFLKIDWN